MERGYACFQYDCGQVSADNETRTGAFFTLYPYEKDNPAEQRGVLLAWAWGVSKILDALEAGAGKKLGINPALSLVGGVSRYGKSTAVAGAYDERIRVTVPSCSGAGGTAVFRTDNHGKTYDLTSLGGPVQWTNESVNEPFSNLQGGEGYWFCGNFGKIPSVRRLPVDQHMLCALMAAPDRHLIIVTGITSEGWNNTEGQCLAYAASQPVWDLLGCGSQNNIIIHLDGHAILPSDMQAILDYCDVCLRGMPRSVDLSEMRGNLFLRHNRNVLDPLFASCLRD
jgi:endo-1,4-beta-xylanase